jgi:hypothetical protein
VQADEPKAAGEIVNVCVDKNGCIEGLAVLALDMADSPHLRLADRLKDALGVQALGPAPRPDDKASSSA